MDIQRGRRRLRDDVGGGCRWRELLGVNLNEFLPVGPQESGSFKDETQRRGILPSPRKASMLFGDNAQARKVKYTPQWT
jgi:hypothetical protein